jgi:2-oxoglutarate dehydrogenase E2 component (dihydrolipoamide succinyltransferase)
MPKLNTVDTSYTLIEWLVPDGTEVAAGDTIAEVETSKAAEELVCDGGGVLHRAVEAPYECPVGAPIGMIFDTAAERDRFLADGPRSPSAAPAADPATGTGLVVTDAARALIDGHHISDETLRTLGKRVIKATDVERLIAAVAPAEERHIPSRAQRAVAATVSLSHATIPAAGLVIKVDIDAALAFLRRFGERDQAMFGPAELMVAAVAALRPQYPLFFACLADDGTATVSAGAHVGVTLDLGNGLYVPVIRDADQRRLIEIAERLMEFRIKALRGEFRSEELAGGSIAISLNDEPAVVFAQPLILPPMVCMLTLCAVQAEVYLDPAGAPRERRYLHVGLAYDHRLINGQDAAGFLGALKTLLEDIAHLEALDAHRADIANGQSATQR